MKLEAGFEEIAQGVRLNDSQSEILTMDEMAFGFGVDFEALVNVQAARVGMLVEAQKAALMARPEIPARIQMYATAGSAWLDGFFAALHVVEQFQSRGLDKP